MPFLALSLKKDSFRNIIASHGYNDPEELQRTWYQQKKLGYA